MKFETWIGLIALLISVYILWQIRQILLLIFTAAIAANALNILIKRFQRWGIERPLAIFMASILLLATLVGFFWGLVPPFIDQFEELVKLVPQGIEQLNIWRDWLADRIDPEIIKSMPDVDELIAQWQPLVNQILERGLTFFYDSLGAMITLILLIVLSMMLLANPVAYREGFVRLFPSFYRHRIEEILLLCDRDLQEWITGIVINMLVTGILSFLVLLILRIPLALSQAMLAGVLTFIPYIGPAMSAIPPMAISLIEKPWKALVVLIVYFLIQQFQSHLLNPVIRKEEVSVLPAMTLLAQIFFTTFFGFLGLFLALPLVVVGKVWVQQVLIRDVLDEWKGKGEGSPIPIRAGIDRSSVALETNEKGNKNKNSDSQLQEK